LAKFGCISTSKDVVFNELWFPYTSFFRTPMLVLLSPSNILIIILICLPHSPFPLVILLLSLCFPHLHLSLPLPTVLLCFLVLVSPLFSPIQCSSYANMFPNYCHKSPHVLHYYSLMLNFPSFHRPLKFPIGSLLWNLNMRLSFINTWDLVPLRPDWKVVCCKWVFRIKQNSDGSVNEFKACLVANNQVPGFDFKPSLQLLSLLLFMLSSLYLWHMVGTFSTWMSTMLSSMGLLMRLSLCLWLPMSNLRFATSTTLSMVWNKRLDNGLTSSSPLLLLLLVSTPLNLIPPYFFAINMITLFTSWSMLMTFLSLAPLHILFNNLLINWMPLSPSTNLAVFLGIEISY